MELFNRLRLFHACPRHSHFHKAWETKRAARKDSPVPRGDIWTCMVYPLHMSVSLENQIAENAEKYSRRYQQAGYFI